ncbi:MAG: hypothetical protein JNK60_14515 [Acidobacteria bacterium]|nr:hypothetical protein [Acidobacteriota bacterium]
MKEREDDAPLLAALSALPREEAPPAGLEERVLDALRAEGLVRSRAARRALPAFLALAAALILFAAGLFVGRWQRPAQSSPPSRYVLLLYRGEMKPPASAEEEAVFVREYTNWMRQQAASGLLVDGEKLGDASRLVGPTEAPDAPDLLGYFIVGVSTFDEAEAIARAHPHARHGGLVVVKEIVSR